MPFIVKQDITVEKGLMQDAPLGILIKRKTRNSFMNKEKEGSVWWSQMAVAHLLLF